MSVPAFTTDFLHIFHAFFDGLSDGQLLQIRDVLLRVYTRPAPTSDLVMSPHNHRILRRLPQPLLFTPGTQRL